MATADTKDFMSSRFESLHSHSAMGADDGATATKKSAADVARLEAATSNNLLFQNLNSADKRELFNWLQEDVRAPGVEVLMQGQAGKDFYLIDHGEVEALKDGVCLTKLQHGASVGELALIYGAAQEATIRTTKQTVFWKIAGDRFRKIMLQASTRVQDRYASFFDSVSCLATLSDDERAQLADAVEDAEFFNGDAIVTEGQASNDMYIVREGTAVAQKHGVGTHEGTMLRYTTGDFFGELGLLTSKPRAASVIAVDYVACVKVKRSVFMQFVGPCLDKLQNAQQSYIGDPHDLASIPMPTDFIYKKPNGSASDIMPIAALATMLQRGTVDEHTQVWSLGLPRWTDLGLCMQRWPDLARGVAPAVPAPTNDGLELRVAQLEATCKSLTESLAAQAGDKQQADALAADISMARLKQLQTEQQAAMNSFEQRVLAATAATTPTDASAGAARLQQQAEQQAKLAESQSAQQAAIDNLEKRLLARMKEIEATPVSTPPTADGAASGMQSEALATMVLAERHRADKKIGELQATIESLQSLVEKLQAETVPAMLLGERNRTDNTIGTVNAAVVELKEQLPTMILAERNRNDSKVNEVVDELRSQLEELNQPPPLEPPPLPSPAVAEDGGQLAGKVDLTLTQLNAMMSAQTGLMGKIESLEAKTARLGEVKADKTDVIALRATAETLEEQTAGLLHSQGNVGTLAALDTRVATLEQQNVLYEESIGDSELKESAESQVSATQEKLAEVTSAFEVRLDALEHEGRLHALEQNSPRKGDSPHKSNLASIERINNLEDRIDLLEEDAAKSAMRDALSGSSTPTPEAQTQDTLSEVSAGKPSLKKKFLGRGSRSSSSDVGSSDSIFKMKPLSSTSSAERRRESHRSEDLSTTSSSLAERYGTRDPDSPLVISPRGGKLDEVFASSPRRGSGEPAVLTARTERGSGNYFSVRRSRIRRQFGHD